MVTQNKRLHPLKSALALPAHLDHGETGRSSACAADCQSRTILVGCQRSYLVGSSFGNGWIRHENSDDNAAALAGTLPPLLNITVLMGAALVGILYLIVVHDLSNTQLIKFVIFLMGLGLSAVGAVGSPFSQTGHTLHRLGSRSV